MAKSILSEKLRGEYKNTHSIMLYMYDILVDVLIKADEYRLSDTEVLSKNGESERI